jgi:hypothetical protein
VLSSFSLMRILFRFQMQVLGTSCVFLGFWWMSSFSMYWSFSFAACAPYVVFQKVHLSPKSWRNLLIVFSRMFTVLLFWLQSLILLEICEAGISGISNTTP